MISWCTSTMPRRSASTGPFSSTGAPSSFRTPRVGGRWPLTIFISVDLPAPFSPMIAWTSPARTSSETSLSTSIGPNERDSPTASRTECEGPAATFGRSDLGCGWVGALGSGIPSPPALWPRLTCQRYLAPRSRSVKRRPLRLPLLSWEKVARSGRMRGPALNDFRGCPSSEPLSHREREAAKGRRVRVRQRNPPLGPDGLRDHGRPVATESPCRRSPSPGSTKRAEGGLTPNAVMPANAGIQDGRTARARPSANTRPRRGSGSPLSPG